MRKPPHFIPIVLATLGVAFLLIDSIQGIVIRGLLDEARFSVPPGGERFFHLSNLAQLWSLLRQSVVNLALLAAMAAGVDLLDDLRWRLTPPDDRPDLARGYILRRIGRARGFAKSDD